MAFSQLTDSQKEDMIVSLSCLVLHGSGKPVDAEGIKAIVEATGHEVAGYWPSLMAKFLAEKDIDELLMKPGKLCSTNTRFPRPPEQVTNDLCLLMKMMRMYAFQ